MTPHISAKKDEIAKTVLLAGDPLRAKYIADNFLKNVKKVSEIRNALFFTGYYNDKKVTVGTSGMGCPSIGIYSYELYKFYDVENIIRIGTGGSYSKDLDVKDVLNVTAAFSQSTYALICSGNKITEDTIDASLEIVNKINDAAKKLNIKITNGKIHSSDVFYNPKKDLVKYFSIRNILAVEMESFALFANAKILNKKAGCILTISDSLLNNKVMTPIERQTNLNKMIKLSLESI